MKSGGGIEPKGKRITLTVTDKSDLNRDVLKSETCDLKIPELEFEMGGAALGGRYAYDQLYDQLFNFETSFLNSSVRIYF